MDEWKRVSARTESSTRLAQHAIWEPPELGWLKANVDGATSQTGHDGVEIALQRQIPKLHVETDCLGVARMLNGHERNLSAVGIVVEEIKTMARNLGDFKTIWVRRNANKAAHELARFGLCNAVSVFWDLAPPDCILSIVSDELPDLV
ncbi:uncharacterized protein [Aegilops tauschii subsp. strangulata]|uniref:uncharacterized protein n=1 Tax=Aegilops tauschii subsp. strangulata TaxID=200361 RepID=UPI003CC89714